MPDERFYKQRERHLAMCKHRRAFAATFGQPIDSFWDKLLGFDVIKFDDEIVKSGDDSTENVLRAKWGDAAVAMIKELMG